jgi:transposase-like protein
MEKAMNLIQMFQRFPDHEACIEHLEAVRWGDEPSCPYCGSLDVARKDEHGRLGRWNCHACKSSFNALSGTIFQKTKIPLQKWFLAIALILNAKKSLSSWQLSRDLDMNQKSAWFLAMRLRRAMAGKEGDLLRGIIEADECYVGGVPRKRNSRDDDKPNPRGRGTAKTPIIGAIARGGEVVAEPTSSVNSSTLSAFIRRNVDLPASLLITDELAGYNAIGKKVRRAVIKHAERYADGIVHTNTMESFWALVKRAWYGQHHHYSRTHTHLYISEACYKYNVRNRTDQFGDFLRLAFAP